MKPMVIRAPVLVAILFTPCALLAQSGTVNVNGVSLPYEIRGEGTPLVLIHGWATHLGYWDPNMEQLARRHRVIRYDRRGFGSASGKKDITADPADLKELLDRIGLPRAHVMGHSEGANVALAFALRYPEMVDGLILFGPGPLPGQELEPSDDFPPEGEWIALANRHGIDSLRATIARWGAEHFGGPKEPIAAMARDILAVYTGADLLDPAPPSNLVALASVSDLADVTASTLVIYGAEDLSFIVATAELLAADIPEARRAVVPGGGHAVNWQEPDRFTADVLQFLQEIERPSR